MRLVRNERNKFALGVKAVFMALALAQVATLWMAIAADIGASLLVIFNALRLLRGERLPLDHPWDNGVIPP